MSRRPVVVLEALSRPQRADRRGRRRGPLDTRALAASERGLDFVVVAATTGTSQALPGDRDGG